MTTPATPSPNRRSQLASRLVAGFAAVGVFTALAWADVHRLGNSRPMAWLVPLVLLVASGAGREAVRLAAGAGIRLAPWLVPLGAAVIAAAPAIVPVGSGVSADPLATIGRAAVACMAVVAAIFVAGIGRYVAGTREVVRVAGSIAAAVVIGLPLSFIVALRLRHAAPAPPDSVATLVPLISLIAAVKAGDIAAYAVGSTVGRNRMAPTLSPGKTWEGAAASLVASLAASWFVLEQVAADQAGQPLGGWVAYGLLVGMAGMAGDLAESLVKRDLGAKDSGRFLGGMGGYLDLIDSLTLAGPVAWLLWTLG